MLNRRYLRIKVYQSLYAFWQSDSNSAARIEKELFLSIERTFDLFFCYCSRSGSSGALPNNASRTAS
ncbi:MAG: hypothetical protein IPL77_10275 [Flavobacteriales bacterium]|nr:hypothetical protein [Flavobacteriales bacterium]